MLKVVNVDGAEGIGLGQIENNDDFYEPHIDYLCPQCGKEFTEKKYWRAHVSQAHGLNHIAFLAHSQFKYYLQNLPYKFYTRCRKCQKCYVHRKQLVSHLDSVHHILQMQHPNPQPKHQPHHSKQTVTVANETFEITFLDDEPKSIQSSFQSSKIKAKAFNDRSYSPPPPPPNSPTSHCYKCKECNSLHNSLVALKMHIRRRHFLHGNYTTRKYITSKSTNSAKKEEILVRKIDRKEDSRESIIPAEKLLSVESTNGKTTGTAIGSRPAKDIASATSQKGNIRDRKIVPTKPDNEDLSLKEPIHPASKPKHDESFIKKTLNETLQRKEDHSITGFIEPTKNDEITKEIIEDEKMVPANKLSNDSSTSPPANNIQDNFQYICPACGLIYKKELDWRRHINEVHHFNKFPYLKMRIRDKNLYQCLVCRASLLASQIKPLQEHHFRHLPHRLYIKCSVCDTCYNYKPNLLTHSVQCPLIAKKRNLNVTSQLKGFLNKPLPPSS